MSRFSAACSAALALVIVVPAAAFIALPAAGTRAASDVLYAYQGTPVVVDGVVDAADRWDEARQLLISDGMGTVSILAKHDGTNLYILCTAFYSTDQVEYIYLEDDGLSPDRSLDSVNEDCKYVGVSGFPDGFRDAHWEGGGWSVNAEYGADMNGGAEASQFGADSLSEWWMPLSTGSVDDINVTSNETLAFFAGRMMSYDPIEWWTLHVVFSRAPADRQAPVANAGPDVSVEPNTQLTLDGTSSTDDHGIITYAWGYHEGGTGRVLYGSVVTVEFPAEGLYSVTLTVADIGGNSDTDTLVVNVTYPDVPDTAAPVADAGQDFDAEVGAAADFDGTGSYDDVGIANYSWYVPLNLTSAHYIYGPAPSFVFPIAGDFDVYLTVKDAAGNQDLDTVKVSVAEPAGEEPEVTYMHYVVTGSATFDGTLQASQYVLFELPAGAKDYGIQAAVLSPHDSADFFVFTEMQLVTYQDGDASYLSFTEAVRDSRSFAFSTNSSDRLYVVIDNTALSSGVPGDAPLDYYIVFTYHAPPIIEDESDGTAFCMGLAGVFITMAVLTTYWLLSSPKKGAMGEPLNRRYR